MKTFITLFSAISLLVTAASAQARSLHPDTFKVKEYIDMKVLHIEGNYQAKNIKLVTTYIGRSLRTKTTLYIDGKAVGPVELIVKTEDDGCGSKIYNVVRPGIFCAGSCAHMELQNNTDRMCEDARPGTFEFSAGYFDEAGLKSYRLFAAGEKVVVQPGKR